LDTMDSKDSISATKLNHCNICNKNWKNDAYCPHSFDEDALWRLRQKTINGKMKVTPFSEYQKFEFWDNKGNFVGEYIEPIKN